jgi:hypothetical protein
MSRSREYRALIVAELSANGVKPTFRHGGKHPFVEWEFCGRRFRQTIPSSPSDVRGLSAARAAVRRAIRYAGQEASL